MTGPEHYREAERLAGVYKEAIEVAEGMPSETIAQSDERHIAVVNARALLDKAQVHATLALTAATAAAMATAYDGDELHERSRGWAGVA